MIVRSNLDKVKRDSYIFDRCPAFNCLQLHGRLFKSYQISQIHSRTIVELNYQVLLSYDEVLLRCKRFKRDCRSRSHIWQEIYFCFFLIIWYCFVNQIFVKRVSYYIRRSWHISAVCLLIDVHIDLWRIIIKDYPKPSRKLAQILLKFFSIFVTRYTKTGLRTEGEILVITWANRIIFYLSFEPLNVWIGSTITKIQPLKAGQS